VAAFGDRDPGTAFPEHRSTPGGVVPEASTRRPPGPVRRPADAGANVTRVRRLLPGLVLLLALLVFL
jgi:hypothetical protein